MFHHKSQSSADPVSILNTATNGDRRPSFAHAIATMRELYSVLTSLSKKPEFEVLRATLRENNQAILLSDVLSGGNNSDSPYGGWVHFLGLTGTGPRILKIDSDSFDPTFSLTGRPIIFELKSITEGGLTTPEVYRRLEKGLKVNVSG
jgi:hypothetical protein